MKKIVSIEYAIENIKDGMTIMIGGFLGCGTPEKFIDEIIKRDIQNLTIIANDTSFIDKGIGRLIANKQVKKVITSHIGTNPETGKQMHSKDLEVNLVPQGTLVEQIRCGGMGLGGFLTPTGIGTMVEEGKEKMKIDGKEYILEKPIRADITLILGNRVDKKGNVTYRKSARNFNPIMAMAADKVIVLAENLLEIGEIEPEDVITPSIFIDYIVKEKQNV
ncbi:acetate CoA/acetoacetate CoA-transferase alpha subunit [Acetoanaerobium pronyense]|uniref:Acetate CoA/acetoacetate CoA-transferase alpha subunit n=1 Tax=Acetoanaerobium pronyense TaxID=1482736 RepID=A0ABS4KKZ2_9FIRM|nr:acetate CoA-transferase subunit alpha [Acetoanaerobium pronyense]MBP2028451.1 acetate CoA/acetoacetate CoA-transferase alpha subunit [Acetoanaerobium pronyense]